MFEQDMRSSPVMASLLCFLAILLAVPSFADSGLRATETMSEADETAVSERDDDPADEDDGQDEETPAPSVTGDSGGLLSKLSVHGFLTQAYAEANFVDLPVVILPGGFPVPLSDSPSANELSLGIPEGGTTNYRFLALQFRYEISSKDVFVVQFSSRALGFSPLQDFEDEIELDWAFYERRLTDHASLKVGRVQIPFGIYNEVRDVGTILPFFRPAFVVYKEGAFTSETVDGLSLGTTFFPDSDWSLEVTGYLGEWESIQIVPPDPSLSGVLRAEDGYGYQIWLNTPLSDLRIGTGLISFKQGESQIPLQALERRDIFHASLDATFGRFTLQAEWDQETSGISLFGLPLNIESTDFYVLAGVGITEKLRLWGQLENNDLSWTGAVLAAPFDLKAREDLGVSLNYFFSPTIVVKGEYHWVDEKGLGFLPLPTGAFQGLVADAPNGSYSILSLSVAF